MPEQPDRNRGLSAAELMQRRAAERAGEVMEGGGAEGAARKEAVHVVERWNAERSPLWSPTIRCAVVAGTPWLDVYCPGCRTIRAIDIHTLDRHPLASVGSLVIGFRCSWCPGSAPMPVLTGLHAVLPAARWSKHMPVEFLHGRPLSPGRARDDPPADRGRLRQRRRGRRRDRGIVARNWPYLRSPHGTLPRHPHHERLDQIARGRRYCIRSHPGDSLWA